MVGVPRSNGCQTCLDRRVKCDETIPECRRCLLRGMKCPGYARALKFCNQGPVLIKQHETRRKKTASAKLRSRSRDRESTSSSSPAPPIRLIFPRPSIDECREPNLVAGALDTQHREVFCSFVMAMFPGLFSSFRTRVDVNWMDWVRHHLASPPHALFWAMRSLNTLHLSRIHNDRGKLMWSRHMYSRALNHFAGLLAHPSSAKTDEALSAAILLGVYELMDGTSQDSWMSHSRGIGQLIQLRGPDAHRRGFGRTLLISFRAFLVAEAFIRGEPCFLEDGEWRSTINDAVNAEGQRGKGSVLGEIVEFAFSEIALCPGLFVRTQAMIAEPNNNKVCVSASMRDDLIHRIRTTKKRLSDLQSRLTVKLARRGGEEEGEAGEDFVGPIPFNFVNTFAHSSLQGMRAAIALLEQMLVLLEADAARRSARPASVAETDPWSLVNVQPAPTIPHRGAESLQVVAFRSGADTKDDWLDRFSLSMGIMGVK